MATIICDPKIEGPSALTKDEAAKLFDQVSRRYLQMSADEFLGRLDSGYFSKHPKLARRLDSVLFYLPLIRG